MLNIIIFGKLPPPIGGVTKSIENLMASLKKKGVQVNLFSYLPTLKRKDIAHIHYSSLLKRCLGVMLGKLFARKVIFTVHGLYLDNSNLFNRISIRLSDGIVLLNQSLFEQCTEYIEDSKLIKLPSLFTEGVEYTEGSEDNSILERSSDGRKRLLLYAYDRSYEKGKEVYGVDFILSLYDGISAKYHLTIIDLSGGYKQDVCATSNDILYIDQPVDFMTMLKSVDIYLRPTSKDGSSVAVQEALLLDTPVLASDVVDRPSGVYLYKFSDKYDFKMKLDMIEANTSNKIKMISVDSYIQFCENLLTR